MERLNEQDRKVILKALMPKIKKDFKTKEKINGEEKGPHGYRVILQGKTFYTVLSDEESPIPNPQSPIPNPQSPIY